ncbi:MAG: nucleoside-diphosphate kinase [Bacteroidales bacterium]|nr:nucleoside-diphosphate kinase [Bacteroidales bacterium]MDD4575184.1 nucleoside-diphosphate kinase [Bacteroidales bacterium]
MEKGKITFTMIKPTAFKNNYTGDILKMIYQKKFRIIALKMMQLTKDQAAAFYIEHKERPFYAELCEFMSSGPIIAAILKKENAVRDYRQFIGSTNPIEAEKGTIRSVFGSSVEQNAVHGSDSDDSAMRESSFFFSDLEIFSNF